MADIWDLPYLFSRDYSREVYRQDTSRNKKTIEKIKLYNKDFSETFFMAWISNMFLRYILLCSDKKSVEKLAKFEKMHLSEKVNPRWHETLQLARYFADVTAKFVDFIEFFHTSDKDSVKLKICLVCNKNKNARITEEIEEEEIHYYDMELEKNNAIRNSDEKNKNYTSNCPCCGAPTTIVTIGVCDHCQELISIYDNVWKIKKIKLDS